MDTITRNHRDDYERWYRANEARINWVCDLCDHEVTQSDWGWVLRAEEGFGSVAAYCPPASQRQRHDPQMRGVIEADVRSGMAQWDAIYRYIVEGIADGSIIADQDIGEAATNLARQGWTPPTR